MRTKEEVEKLVESNIGLVWYVIRRNFTVTVNYNNSLVDDMYQEGCIGLWKAAQRFDESKGYKFNTYAYKVVLQSILRFKERYIDKHYDRAKTLYSDKENEDGLKVIDLLSTEEDFGVIEINEILNKVSSYLNEKEKLVLKMRLEGSYQKEIAVAIKGTQVNVSRICVKIRGIITKIENDEEVITRNERREKTSKRIEMVRKLYLQGKMYKDIAKELNIPKGSISSYLRVS